MHVLAAILGLWGFSRSFSRLKGLVSDLAYSHCKGWRGWFLGVRVKICRKIRKIIYWHYIFVWGVFEVAEYISRVDIRFCLLYGFYFRRRGCKFAKNSKNHLLTLNFGTGDFWGRWVHFKDWFQNLTTLCGWF